MFRKKSRTGIELNSRRFRKTMDTSVHIKRRKLSFVPIREPIAMQYGLKTIFYFIFPFSPVIFNGFHREPIISGKFKKDRMYQVKTND